MIVSSLNFWIQQLTGAEDAQGHCELPSPACLQLLPNPSVWLPSECCRDFSSSSYTNISSDSIYRIYILRCMAKPCFLCFPLHWWKQSQAAVAYNVLKNKQTLSTRCQKQELSQATVKTAATAGINHHWKETEGAGVIKGHNNTLWTLWTWVKHVYSCEVKHCYVFRYLHLNCFQANWTSGWSLIKLTTETLPREEGAQE